MQQHIKCGKIARLFFNLQLPFCAPHLTCARCVAIRTLSTIYIHANIIIAPRVACERFSCNANKSLHMYRINIMAHIARVLYNNTREAISYFCLVACRLLWCARFALAGDLIKWPSALLPPPPAARAFYLINFAHI